MPVNYLQLQPQITEFAARSRRQQEDSGGLLELALKRLDLCAGSQPELIQKILRRAAADPRLRCALPVGEPVNSVIPAPDEVDHFTVIAADGSQVIPSRHRRVGFGVINISTVAMELGSGKAPEITVDSNMLDPDPGVSGLDPVSEGYINLLRDVAERSKLAKEAAKYPPPLITLTDGGLELFHEPGLTEAYSHKLQEYLQVMHELMRIGAVSAAYVDKPASGLVLQMLDEAVDISDGSGTGRLSGLPDRFLFEKLLSHPGDRSALFRILSASSADFTGPLALHFFYLNISRQGQPDIVRVEVPAWVAEKAANMQSLHSVLIQQTSLLANSYPYVLHRAHEEAVVTYDDVNRLEELIIEQLLQAGVHIRPVSNKQTLKNSYSRRRYGK